MRKVSVFLIGAALIAASHRAPVFAQDKAADVLANVRKAIGAGKLDTLKTFSLEAKTARNVGERQMTGDVEIYVDLPDKYLRVENVTAPIARTMTSGFNGDKVIRPAANAMGGGGMIIINGVPMGGGGAPPPPGAVVVTTVVGGRADGAPGARGGNTPPTPEQQAMMNTALIRSQRVDLSRFMLGWFGMAHPGLNVTYSYAGEAESPDGKAHVIDVKADGGFAAKLFVDQSTNLPLMLTYVQQERVFTNTAPAAAAPASPPIVPHTVTVPPGAPPPPPPPAHPGQPAGGQRPQMTPEEMQKRIEEMRKTPPTPVEYRIYFSDWKEADGVQFPHLLQRARGGNTTEEWTITKVKINPKIDAKKFS